MNRKKIGISIIVAILIFFCFVNTSQAFLFWNDDDDKEDDKSDIEETIEIDDGGLFEKIIAKMIRWNCRNSFRFNNKRCLRGWF